jgi:AP-4 complex subunit mu-1
MLSQFFILSSRGDTIAFKDYRGDVVKGTADIFYRKVNGWKGSQAPPIFNVEGIHFIHIRRSGMYFVFTTKFNVSPAFVLETLNRLCNLFKDYCGVLNEESLRLNFVLIYELLDEVLDFGYPQVLSTESLKTHVHNQPVAVEVEKQHQASFMGSSGPSNAQRSVPSSAANKPIAVSLEQKRVQKNELFVDLLERLTVLIGADVRHCFHIEVGSLSSGQTIHMKTYVYRRMNERKQVSRQS